MGVIKRGLLGGFSGRVGNIVGSSWKGIAVIKSLPLSVANPKTAAQVAHRQDFADTVAFAKNTLAVVIKPLWDRFASQQSGFNAFVQSNINKLSDVVNEKYADFKTSIGKMSTTSISIVPVNPGDSGVNLEWNPAATGQLQQSSDIAVIAYMKNDEVSVIETDSSAIRSDGNASLMGSISFAAGDVAHVFLAFKREDGTIVNTSSHSSFTVV